MCTSFDIKLHWCRFKLELFGQNSSHFFCKILFACNWWQFHVLLLSLWWISVRGFFDGIWFVVGKMTLQQIQSCLSFSFAVKWRILVEKLKTKNGNMAYATCHRKAKQFMHLNSNYRHLHSLQEQRNLLLLTAFSKFCAAFLFF